MPPESLPTQQTFFQKLEGDVSGVIHIRCTTVGEILNQSNALSEKVRAHIIYWFMNPDIGSNNDGETRIFRNIIPKTWIIPLMRFRGYDGIIALWNNKIIGHAFFQKHKKKTGHELHLFSIAVTEEIQERGIGTKIGQAFVEFGRNPQRQITRLRMGGGGDARMKAIFTKIERQSDERGISTNPDFFITFNDRVARLVDTTIFPPKT